MFSILKFYGLLKKTIQYYPYNIAQQFFFSPSEIKFYQNMVPEQILFTKKSVFFSLPFEKNPYTIYFIFQKAGSSRNNYLYRVLF